jgi:tripartite-type tricarboxylate transporter receptor subunit TctC
MGHRFFFERKQIQGWTARGFSENMKILRSGTDRAALLASISMEEKLPQRSDFLFSPNFVDESRRAVPWQGRFSCAIAAVLVALGMLAAPAWGQSFPERPIRLVLGFAPGGLTDFTGRVVAQGMSKVLGQPVVPENKPGAAGVTAAAFVANSAPDGYTIILVDPGTLTNPLMRRGVPYKMSDLTGIGLIGSTPVFIVTSNELPARSLKELVEYGRNNPGKLTYGSPGVGSVGHLAAELLLKTSDFKATHVPYPTTSQILPDLISNRVPLGFSTVPSAMSFVLDHKARGMATTGSKRASLLPDVPTAAESGFPDLTVDIWLALAAPKGLPDAIAKKLNEALVTTLREPAAIAALQKVGIDASPSSPEEINKLFASEDARWLPVIEAAGLKDR